MSSHREQVLAALLSALETLSGPTVRRNEPLPEKLPAGGLVMLRDGELGEPEILLSPLSYIWRHRAIIEAMVSGGTAAPPQKRMPHTHITANTSPPSGHSVHGTAKATAPT